MLLARVPLIFGIDSCIFALQNTPVYKFGMYMIHAFYELGTYQVYATKRLVRCTASKCNCFLEFFSKLNPRRFGRACRAIIDRTIMCQRTRDFLMATPNASEIPTITYRLNSPFFSRWPPTPRILGRAGLKIATLQTGSHHFISVEPANLSFVCDACEDWWVCG
jgi:hypothetical protein